MSKADVRARAAALGAAWAREIAKLPPSPINPDDVTPDADVGELFEHMYANAKTLKSLGEIHEAFLRLLDDIGGDRDEWQ